MKIFATILLLLICSGDYAQTAPQKAYPDTVHLDQDRKKTTSADWVFYHITTPAAGGKYTAETFLKNGVLVSRGMYSAIEPKRIKDGHFTYFSENGAKIRDCYFEDNRLEGEELIGDTLGNLKIKASFHEGKLNGHRIEYYTTGVIKRDEIYKDSLFISGNCYDEKGKKMEFLPRGTRILPEYPGGEKAANAFIRTHIKYPKADMDANVQGRVIVKFVVEADGSVSNIGIARGVDTLMDEAAMDVVRLFPKFKPGTEDGRPVRSDYVLPIDFALHRHD